MSYEPHHLARVRRIVNPLARQNGMTAMLPLPCWDSTDMGVELLLRKSIAGRDHLVVSNFPLNERELDDEAAITRKANLAVDAIKNMVLCSVRPVKTKEKEKAA